MDGNNCFKVFAATEFTFLVSMTETNSFAISSKDVCFSVNANL